MKRTVYGKCGFYFANDSLRQKEKREDVRRSLPCFWLALVQKKMRSLPMKRRFMTQFRVCSIALLSPMIRAGMVNPSDTKNQYDPVNESPLYVCRRNPTWRVENNVDYLEPCRQLTGWKPRDFWWRNDTRPVEQWLSKGMDEKITACLDKSFQSVPKDKWWSACNESQRTDACRVEDARVMAHYAHLEEGDIVQVRNVLSEQEAYGIQSLAQCMKSLLPNKAPFYKDRLFGKGEYGDELAKEELSLYTGSGGNMCTFMQGMIQKHLPGAASSIVHAIQKTFEQSDWNKMDISPPNELGLRSAEFLAYNKTGRLGVHVDKDSIYTISVSLSNGNDYEGGYFHLYSEQALFKVPRLSAVVFFSETNHGITPVDGGNRQVFVVEMWEDDDTPIGLPRPGYNTFEDYQRKHRTGALSAEARQKG